MQEEDCKELPGCRVPAVWFFSRSVSPRAAWSCRLGGLRKSGEQGWEASRGGSGSGCAVGSKCAELPVSCGSP